MSRIVRRDDQTVIMVEQNIISTTAKDFREELLAMIKPDTKELIIDLTGVEMIDSVGLGVFIATHNGLNKIEGKLKVINVAPNILNLFKTMGLDRHFEVVGTGDIESIENDV